MRRMFLFGAALILAITGGSVLAARPAITASNGGFATGSQARASGRACCSSATAAPSVPGAAALSPSLLPHRSGSVDAARPGDWILIYPGVYHEKSKRWPTAGVWVQKPGLHVRGLDRNRVIIDGSKGTPRTRARRPPLSRTSRHVTGSWCGRPRFTIQNLTVCDYLAGGGDHGNEIWWNGGDGTGTIGLGAYSGSYLAATSEYAPARLNSPQLAQYGIFVSNSRGPGLITNSYASNMADAAYYVGACRRVCNTALADDTGVNSALGYSGTNSGGQLGIRNSVFRLNRAGIVPNSENNDDAPPPQDGRCPGSATRSCTIIEDNLSRRITTRTRRPTGPSRPSGPASRSRGLIRHGDRQHYRGSGLVGDTHHRLPDSEKPPSGAHCQGGIPNDPLPGVCLFQARGNLVYGNVFSHDGFFGNLTNSDLATETLASYTPRNCFYGNADRDGTVTSAPASIESASVDGQPADGRHRQRSGAGRPARLRHRGPPPARCRPSWRATRSRPAP